MVKCFKKDRGRDNSNSRDKGVVRENKTGNESPGSNKAAYKVKLSSPSSAKSKIKVETNITSIFNSLNASSLFNNKKLMNYGANNSNKNNSANGNNQNNLPTVPSLNNNINNSGHGRRNSSPYRFNALFNKNSGGSKSPKNRSNSPTNLFNQFNNNKDGSVKKEPININSSLTSNANNKDFKLDSEKKTIINTPISSSSSSFVVKDYFTMLEQNMAYRNDMEDYINIVENFQNSPNKALFTLYDGHGGSDPVKYSNNRFPELFSKILSADPDHVEVCMKKTFNSLDEELKFSDSENTGCTASIVYIEQKDGENVLYSANVGDSRSYLVGKNTITKLTFDHKCTVKEEVDRVRAAGGIVFNGRVFGQLVLTRALGDHALKPYGVISDPYIVKETLTADHTYLILASDGIWDVITEENLLNFSKNFDNSKDFCAFLVKHALTKGSKDNISCIVVRLSFSN